MYEIVKCDHSDFVAHRTFLTASKYCGSGLKIGLVVFVDVVVVIRVVVIKLLSNSSPFVKV